jgi:hypothetical protein
MKVEDMMAMGISQGAKIFSSVENEEDRNQMIFYGASEFIIKMGLVAGLYKEDIDKVKDHKLFKEISTRMESDSDFKNAFEFNMGNIGNKS